jgi:hypothetical protein
MIPLFFRKDVNQQKTAPQKAKKSPDGYVTIPTPAGSQASLVELKIIPNDKSKVNAIVYSDATLTLL